MNLELFIARRIHWQGEKGKKRMSSPAIKIATAGVAVGLAAMILAISIVIGFKKEVGSKVVGFGSHIQVTNFSNSTSYETLPIRIDNSLCTRLSEMKGIKHVETFVTKPGIIKTEDAFQGIILKGVGDDFNWDFFKSNLIEGSIITTTNDSVTNTQTIVSKNIADKLHLKVGDSFICFFAEEKRTPRKFKISGIYSTNFEDYDKLFVLADIKLIQRLNDWDRGQVSGIEILVDDFDKLDHIKEEIFMDLLAYEDKDGNAFLTRSVKDLNPMIFQWLGLLDMNVVVIIILMLAISTFTMISGLLIIILEQTRLIGILKTMGARNYSIRKIFLHVSSFLVIKGMVWGNVIAIAILLIQRHFGIFKLDPATYYTSEVPVDINIFYIVLLNLGTLFISMLMMVGPSYMIAKISPVKSIRYE